MPGGLAGADLHDAASEALLDDSASLIEDEHDGESNRQIITVDLLRP